MKKQLYAITKRGEDGIETEYVQGYIYKCGGVFFGVVKDIGKYRITELSTGLLVSGGGGINPRTLAEIPDALVKVLQIPKFKEIIAKEQRYYPEQAYDSWEEVLRPEWESVLNPAG